MSSKSYKAYLYPDKFILMHEPFVKRVAGQLDEIRSAVAAQLHVTFDKKSIEDIKSQVVVDVIAYNSKVYYVITDGGGYGAQMYSMWRSAS